MQMWVRLALTMPPIQVSTGLLLPPLVTRETRRVCMSLLDIDASSALGARPLHMTWRQSTEKFEIHFLKLQTIRGSRTFDAESETESASPVRLGRSVVWG